jgi:homoserine O-acetyltransferase
MNGDTQKALASIKAKTLVMVGTKDLLNPEWEPEDAARAIPNAKTITISPGSVTGHAAAGGAIPTDVVFINREAAVFLNQVTDGGRKLD